jgi:hypothetical protein
LHYKDPRWKDHDTWMCLNHVPPVSLPAMAGQCWMRGCPAERPIAEARPEPVAVSRPSRPKSFLTEGATDCAWDDCDKLARAGSKYCSRKCSNKNARRRFRERKREDVEAA